MDLFDPPATMLCEWDDSGHYHPQLWCGPGTTLDGFAEAIDELLTCPDLNAASVAHLRSAEPHRQAFREGWNPP